MNKVTILFVLLISLLKSNDVQGLWRSDSLYQTYHWITGTDTTVTEVSYSNAEDYLYLKYDGTGVYQIYDEYYPDIPDEYQVTYAFTDSILIVNYPEDSYYETPAYSDTLEYNISLASTFEMKTGTLYNPCDDYDSISECSDDYLEDEVDSFEQLLIYEEYTFNRSYTVVINEFLAANETCCIEPSSGETSDFVELYNYGSDIINISGWGFSDESGSVKTTAPDNSMIEPGDYFILWFSGEDLFPQIDAKLSSEGEKIYIEDDDGLTVLNYSFNEQSNDISFGLYMGEMIYMTPSPNETNTEFLSISSDNNSLNDAIILSRYKLHQNYPNPFNPSTNISFSIPSDNFVNITIYDMLGKEVNILLNQFISAGSHSFKWDAKNIMDNNVPAGVYFYRIDADKFHQSKKMILLK